MIGCVIRMAVECYTYLFVTHTFQIPIPKPHFTHNQPAHPAPARAEPCGDLPPERNTTTLLEALVPGHSAARVQLIRRNLLGRWCVCLSGYSPTTTAVRHKLIKQDLTVATSPPTVSPDHVPHVSESRESRVCLTYAQEGGSGGMPRTLGGVSIAVGEFSKKRGVVLAAGKFQQRLKRCSTTDCTPP